MEKDVYCTSVDNIPVGGAMFFATKDKNGSRVTFTSKKIFLSGKLDKEIGSADQGVWKLLETAESRIKTVLQGATTRAGKVLWTWDIVRQAL